MRWQQYEDNLALYKSSAPCYLQNKKHQHTPWWTEEIT